jgi:hypothetical protein
MMEFIATGTQTAGSGGAVESFKVSCKHAFIASAVILAAAFATSANAKNGATHLQVLINIADPSFKFVINDGTGLHYNNPFYPRYFGSNYILNGLIFPGGTVNVNQNNYTVNTHGVPLTSANSIGEWDCLGNVLSNLLDLPNVPSQPTIAEAVTWIFHFTNVGRGDPNNIYTSDTATTGVFAAKQPLFTVVGAVVGGTGPNDNIGGDLKAEIYFQPSSSSMLINLTFDNEIKY